LTPDLDTVFIQAKLFFMVERLEYLKKYYPSSVDELSQDFERVKAVEKVIQEIVDCAVDINQYLAEGLLNVAIRSNKDSFWRVQGILKRDETHIKKLIDTVSFRNEIVHSYDAGIRVIWKKRTVGYFVDIYRDYVGAVNRLLTSIAANG
jgi:uncharacterized protein YutE (UPF0331/DUF86 family)